MPGGRPPKPTKIRIAEGVRGHKPLNRNEPEPIPGMPDPPHGLLPEVLKSYHDTAHELDRLGLLSLVDHQSYNQAHVALNSAVMASRDLVRFQKKILNGEGEQQDYYKLSVQNAVWTKNLATYKAIMTTFGASGPSSRANLSVDPKRASKANMHEPQDPIERALSGLPN